MKQVTINHILLMEPEEQEMTVKGWVRSRRDSKGISFLELNDGSTIKNLQVIIDETFPDHEKTVKRICTGCSLSVTGNLIASPAKGQKCELKALAIDLIGETPPDYVLQKKRHSFEFLREIAHLRPRTNTFGAVARVRSAMSFAIHTFFQERDFIYIHNGRCTVCQYI